MLDNYLNGYLKVLCQEMGTVLTEEYNVTDDYACLTARKTGENECKHLLQTGFKPTPAVIDALYELKVHPGLLFATPINHIESVLRLSLNITESSTDKKIKTLVRYIDRVNSDDYGIDCPAELIDITDYKILNFMRNELLYLLVYNEFEYALSSHTTIIAKEILTDLLHNKLMFHVKHM